MYQFKIRVFWLLYYVQLIGGMWYAACSMFTPCNQFNTTYPSDAISNILLTKTNKTQKETNKQTKHKKKETKIAKNKQTKQQQQKTNK